MYVEVCVGVIYNAVVVEKPMLSFGESQVYFEVALRQ